MEAARVLVAGGTGYVGGRLVPELLDAGHEVCVLARTPAKLRGRAFVDHPKLEVARGDVLDEDSVATAAAGCDAAYYLVHSLGVGRDFARIDEQAARSFARGCARAGVRHIVYLSALADSGSEHLSEHLASRQRTAEALRSAGVPVTELRAGIVIGSGSQSFEIIHDLARRLPVMIAPRWSDSWTEPIAIRDVIAYLIGVLHSDAARGGTFEIGGGERLRYRELLEICGEELGRRPKVITVPVLTPKLSSYWLHLVTSVDMNVARPLIEGLRNDSVTTEQQIRELVPVDLTPYREAVRRALVRRHDPVVRWSRWTDSWRGPRSNAAGGRAVRTFRDQREFESRLTPAALFERVVSIGGANGYGGALDGLWAVRGAVDRVLGGPGLRRGRPRGPLHEGDPLDFWRVERLDAPHRLALVAEMLVPGTARLDFRVEPAADGAGSRLIQTATLESASWRGAAYWFAVLPFHGLVFARLGTWIARSHSPADVQRPSSTRRT